MALKDIMVSSICNQTPSTRLARKTMYLPAAWVQPPPSQQLRQLQGSASLLLLAPATPSLTSAIVTLPSISIAPFSSET
jgi:hypothetical protein